MSIFKLFYITEIRILNNFDLYGRLSKSRYILNYGSCIFSIFRVIRRKRDLSRNITVKAKKCRWVYENQTGTIHSHVSTTSSSKTSTKRFTMSKHLIELCVAWNNAVARCTICSKFVGWIVCLMNDITPQALWIWQSHYFAPKSYLRDTYAEYFNILIIFYHLTCVTTTEQRSVERTSCQIWHMCTTRTYELLKWRCLFTFQIWNSGQTCGWMLS